VCVSILSRNYISQFCFIILVRFLLRIYASLAFLFSILFNLDVVFSPQLLGFRDFRVHFSFVRAQIFLLCSISDSISSSIRVSCSNSGSIEISGLWISRFHVVCVPSLVIALTRLFSLQFVLVIFPQLLGFQSFSNLCSVLDYLWMMNQSKICWFNSFFGFRLQQLLIVTCHSTHSCAILVYFDFGEIVGKC